MTSQLKSKLTKLRNFCLETESNLNQHEMSKAQA